MTLGADQGTGTAKARWDKLDGKRSTLLNRMRRCASLTIPHLLPPEGTKETDQLYSPYQGLGARSVNNLSAKLLLTLLPPNSPFYRLDVDPVMLEELKAQLGDDKFKTQVEEVLVQHEKMGVKLIERNAYRVQLFRVLRLLIVTGNALIEMPTKNGKPVDGRFKVHRVDKYVIRRSPNGTPLEIIIREIISPEEIPAGINYQQETKSNKDEEEIELFTYCKRQEDKWYVFQECLGQMIPGAEGYYPVNNFPLIPLTWTLAEGENYGRGHVEEHLGDLISLDGLSQALLEGAAIMAKIIFLVATNGVTNVEDLKKVVNGGFAAGRKEDISVLQAEKYADFKIAYEESMRIERRLANAFLLTDSIRRDAERVTAFELRIMAQELEDALGGVYSVLSQELQFPLATRILAQLPPLPKGVQPTIITGFDALGRGHDLQKLNALMQQLAPLQDQLQTWLQIDEYIARCCNALGIDKTGLITPRAVVDQMMEQANQQQLIQQFMPMIKEMVNQGLAGQMGNQGAQPNAK